MQDRSGQAGGREAGVRGGLSTLRHVDVGDVTPWLWRAPWSTALCLTCFFRATAIRRRPKSSSVGCWTTNLVEQSHRATRRRVRQQRGFRSRRRAQGFLDLHACITNLHHPARCTIPSHHRRHDQPQAFSLWRAPARGGLNFRPPDFLALLYFFESNHLPQPCCSLS